MALIFFAICIFLYVSQMTCIVKRLHDRDLSGYWLLLASILAGVSISIFKLNETTEQSPFLVEMITSFVFLTVFLYWFLLSFLLAGVFDIMFGRDITTMTTQLPLTVEVIFGLMLLFILLGSVIYLFFLKGTKGDNKYGPDPLQEGNLHVPKLSKKVLLLVVGLPTIYLVILSPIIVIKKGFKGGLEEIKKVVESTQVKTEK